MAELRNAGDLRVQALTAATPYVILPEVYRAASYVADLHADRDSDPGAFMRFVGALGLYAALTGQNEAALHMGLNGAEIREQRVRQE